MLAVNLLAAACDRRRSGGVFGVTRDLPLEQGAFGSIQLPRARGGQARSLSGYVRTYRRVAVGASGCTSYRADMPHRFAKTPDARTSSSRLMRSASCEDRCELHLLPHDVVRLFRFRGDRRATTHCTEREGEKVRVGARQPCRDSSSSTKHAECSVVACSLTPAHSPLRSVLNDGLARSRYRDVTVVEVPDRRTSHGAFLCARSVFVGHGSHVRT